MHGFTSKFMHRNTSKNNFEIIFFNNLFQKVDRQRLSHIQNPWLAPTWSSEDSKSIALDYLLPQTAEVGGFLNLH